MTACMDVLVDVRLELLQTSHVQEDQYQLLITVHKLLGFMRELGPLLFLFKLALILIDMARHLPLFLFHHSFHM